MKVEQLKAELVVFKGLMSNVSAATAPLTLPLRAPPQGTCNQAQQACGPLSSCPPPLPPLSCAACFFCPRHLLIQEKKKEQKSLRCCV